MLCIWPLPPVTVCAPYVTCYMIMQLFVPHEERCVNVFYWRVCVLNAFFPAFLCYNLYLPRGMAARTYWCLPVLKFLVILTGLQVWHGGSLDERGISYTYPRPACSDFAWYTAPVHFLSSFQHCLGASHG